MMDQYWASVTDSNSPAHGRSSDITAITIPWINAGLGLGLGTEWNIELACAFL